MKNKIVLLIIIYNYNLIAMNTVKKLPFDGKKITALSVYKEFTGVILYQAPKVEIVHYNFKLNDLDNQKRNVLFFLFNIQNIRLIKSFRENSEIFMNYFFTQKNDFKKIERQNLIYYNYLNNELNDFYLKESKLKSIASRNNIEKCELNFIKMKIVVYEFLKKNNIYCIEELKVIIPFLFAQCCKDFFINCLDSGVFPIKFFYLILKDGFSNYKISSNYIKNNKNKYYIQSIVIAIILYNLRQEFDDLKTNLPKLENDMKKLNSINNFFKSYSEFLAEDYWSNLDENMHFECSEEIEEYLQYSLNIIKNKILNYRNELVCNIKSKDITLLTSNIILSEKAISAILLIKSFIFNFNKTLFSSMKANNSMKNVMKPLQQDSDKLKLLLKMNSINNSLLMRAARFLSKKSNNYSTDVSSMEFYVLNHGI